MQIYSIRYFSRDGNCSKVFIDAEGISYSLMSYPFARKHRIENITEPNGHVDINTTSLLYRFNEAIIQHYSTIQTMMLVSSCLDFLASLYNSANRCCVVVKLLCLNQCSAEPQP